jgi:hypothetical protein
LMVNFDKAIFRKQLFKNLKASIYVGQNRIAVHSLGFYSDVLSGNARFVFSLPLFRPYINAFINVTNLKGDKIHTLFPTFNRKENEFNFLSSGHYDVDVDFNGKGISLGNYTKFEKLKGVMTLSGGVLNLQDMEGDVYDGHVKVRANAHIIGPSMQVGAVFNASNVDPAMLLGAVYGYKKLAGYVSMAGSIGSFGKDSHTVLQNAKGQFDFVGKNIKFSGMQLDDIISALDYKAGPAEHKAAVMKYYSKYGDTYFNSLKGSVKVDGGIISVSDVLMKNSRVSGSYSGRINLIGENIKSLAQIAFIPSGSYSAVKMKFRTEGVFPTLQTTVDMSDLHNYIKFDPHQGESGKNAEVQDKVPLKLKAWSIIRDLLTRARSKNSAPYTAN